MEHLVTVINLNLIKVNNRRIVANLSEQKGDELVPETSASKSHYRCQFASSALFTFPRPEIKKLPLCTYTHTCSHSEMLFCFFAVTQKSTYTGAEVLVEENVAMCFNQNKVI